MAGGTLSKLIAMLALLAASLVAQAQGAAAAPAAGATWKYSYSDALYGRQKQSFTVRADSVAGSAVSDTLAAEGTPGSPATFDTRAPRFVVRALAGGKTLVEALAYGPADAAPGVSGYPQGSKTFLEWKVVVQPAAGEEIKVLAGSFRAQRIVVEGTRPRDEDPFWWAKESGRFRYTLWYAPEAQRYVRARHQAWAMSGAEFVDELVELLEFRAN